MTPSDDFRSLQAENGGILSIERTDCNRVRVSISHGPVKMFVCADICEVRALLPADLISPQAAA